MFRWNISETSSVEFSHLSASFSGFGSVQMDSSLYVFIKIAT